MGGVNPTIQPAAASDRRGVTATIDLDRLRVHIDTGDHMLIKPLTEGRKPGDYGREWTWAYGGRAGTHPRDDYERAADAVVTFLTSDPALDDTARRYRVDHMGMSFEEETNEALARHRERKWRDTAPGT